MQNYDAMTGPLFQGNYAPSVSATVPLESMKVVSWNIQFGRNVEAAGRTLQEVEALQSPDLLLLQEMDEAGVDAIARALRLNYVYFPAAVHARHDRNFGNAILSPWPLSDPQKRILPHPNPRDGQQRIATQAVVTVGATRVLAYSVHTETFWLGPERRQAQVDAVGNAVVDALQGERTSSPVDMVIVGGDFNTLTPASIRRMEERLVSLGLVRLSAGVGHTVTVGPLRLHLDHILGTDRPVVESGVWRETAVSDHDPIWVQVMLP